jgi:hypothetical protein
MRACSGRRAEGHLVTEGHELVNEVSGLALLVDAAIVEVDAQIDEAAVGIGEEVPDDDQDGAFDGNETLQLAPSAYETSMAFAEERVGLRCRSCHLTELEASEKELAAVTAATARALRERRMNLRDIGTLTGVSYQRVHQLVSCTGSTGLPGQAVCLAADHRCHHSATVILPPLGSPVPP